MAKPNSFLSATVRVDRPVAGPEHGSLLLADGRRLDFDPQNPRSRAYADVAAQLEALAHPIYVEIDPATNRVAHMLVPRVGAVVRVAEVPRGLEVELATSHARLLLPRDAPDYSALAARLRLAAAASGRPAIVAVDDAQHILDVIFPAPGPVHEPAPRPGPAADAVKQAGGAGAASFLSRLAPRGCVSRARAQQIFNAMAAQTCHPAGIAPPCIPFLFPDDGCWGRAHAMRRLMANMGVTCRKLWIVGSLHTATRNNPNCFVDWAWHVAPTICVIVGYRAGILPITQRMVIDPSLFTAPVTFAQWKSVQGDPNATLTETDGSIFHLPNQTDPSYVQTDQVLTTYRAALQLRVAQVGPPPYANCP